MLCREEQFSGVYIYYVFVVFEKYYCYHHTLQMLIIVRCRSLKVNFFLTLGKK